MRIVGPKFEGWGIDQLTPDSRGLGTSWMARFRPLVQALCPSLCQAAPVATVIGWADEAGLRLLHASLPDVRTTHCLCSLV